MKAQRKEIEELERERDIREQGVEGLAKVRREQRSVEKAG